ncbi:hypothetical protein Tco_0329294 [Tanacetum coccineum]
MTSSRHMAIYGRGNSPQRLSKGIWVKFSNRSFTCLRAVIVLIQLKAPLNNNIASEHMRIMGILWNPAIRNDNLCSVGSCVEIRRSQEIVVGGIGVGGVGWNVMRGCRKKQTGALPAPQQKRNRGFCFVHNPKAVVPLMYQRYALNRF